MGLDDHEKWKSKEDKWYWHINEDKVKVREQDETILMVASYAAKSVVSQRLSKQVYDMLFNAKGFIWDIL